MECDGAEWPLSKKFGCSPRMASDLLVKARRMGLDPYGLSFHDGSQQADLGQSDTAVAQRAQLLSDLQEADADLRMDSLGRGLPARHRPDVPLLAAYTHALPPAMTCPDPTGVG